VVVAVVVTVSVVLGVVGALVCGGAVVVVVAVVIVLDARTSKKCVVFRCLCFCLFGCLLAFCWLLMMTLSIRLIFRLRGIAVIAGDVI